MSQAKAIITTNARPLSMLDAIAPNRERHTHNTTKRTGALINTLAADLAAQGPGFPVVVYEPRNPYATVWGKIIDQPKFTAWEMARIAAQVAAPDRTPKAIRPLLRPLNRLAMTISSTFAFADSASQASVSMIQ